MFVDIPDFALFLGRFHPLVVHLPIGFLLLAIIIALVSKRQKFKQLKASLDFVLSLGAASAVLACILGYMLSLGGEYDPDTLFWHQWLGIGLAALSVLLYWVRSKKQEHKRRLVWLHSTYPFFAILVLLTFTGHYGGNLTHGSTYLFQYAPNPLRVMAGLEPKAAPRPPVTVLDSADVFLDVVHPLIQSKCNSCHNADKKKGQLLLTTYDDMLKGGKEGPSLVPGNLQASLMYQRVTLPSSHEDYMPAEGKTGLTADEVAILGWWISHEAPQSKQLAYLDLDKEISPKFKRVLGFGASDSRLPDKQIAAADSSAIKAALTQGFIVKSIYPESNFIEIKLPFTGQKLADMDVQVLLPLKDQITWLDFAHGEVKDQHLEAIGQLTSLSRLNLSNNTLTDAGIKQLMKLHELTYLNLYGTDISDAALADLKALPKLKSLYLWQTQVSDEGVAAFKAERPDVRVTVGESFMSVTEPDSADSIGG